MTLVTLVSGRQSGASHAGAGSVHPGVVMVVPGERQEGRGLGDVQSGPAGHDDSRHGQHRSSLLAGTLASLAWLSCSRLRLVLVVTNPSLLWLRLLLGLRLWLLLGCLAG